jgi:hypothetical protein
MYSYNQKKKEVFIKLHAPTSSTQKLKLMERGEQFTYIPTVFISKINYRAISANITMKSELLFHTIREIM